MERCASVLCALSQKIGVRRFRIQTCSVQTDSILAWFYQFPMANWKTSTEIQRLDCCYKTLLAFHLFQSLVAISCPPKFPIQSISKHLCCRDDAASWPGRSILKASELSRLSLSSIFEWLVREDMWLWCLATTATSRLFQGAVLHPSGLKPSKNEPQVWPSWTW